MSMATRHHPLRGRQRTTRSLAALVLALATLAAAAVDVHRCGAAPCGASAATLPGTPTPAAARAGADSLAVSAAEYLGWKYFHVYCFRCHGVDAFGGQLAPDLRHSVGPQGSVTHEVFVTTVKEGRLPKGMPAWKTMLSDEQIEGLYAYVTARSAGRLAPGRPHLATK